MANRSIAKSDLPLSFTFLDESDPHKYIKYWASGMHRIINRIMRKSLPAESMARQYPACAYFVQQTFKLFYDDDYSHTLTREQLASECSMLYRGVSASSEMFETDDTVSDSGFMSFSKERFVAADFTRARAGNADHQPMIINLPVHKLHRTARCVSINRSVDPAFNDEEILLLPGKIVLSRDINGTGVRKVAFYEVNNAFVDSLLGMDLPVPEPEPEPADAESDPGPGSAAKRAAPASSPFRRSAVLTSKIVPESLGRTYLVYYRAIHGRPAEVLTWRVLPENATELVRNVRYYVPNSCDSHVYTVLPYIPEYRDMEERYKKGVAEGPDELSEYMQDRLSRRMASYEMHAAVYDPVAKRVITMNLATPRVFFRELYPDLYNDRLEEAHDAIVAHFAELGDKAPRFSPVT